MRKLLAFVVVAVISLSCGSEPTITTPGVATVQVTPGVDTLFFVGKTRQLSATVKDAAGTALTGRTITWTSSNTGVATVSAAGLVTAVGNGLASIQAMSETVSGAAQVAVAQLVASVTVTPGNTGLASIGLTQQFTAVAKDSGGTTVAINRFIWISSDPAVATVDTLGLARAKRAGQTTITAAGQGIPGNAVLSVTQNASSLAYRVAPPTTTVAGDPFSRAVQVEIRDAGGAVVADAQLPVTLTSSGGTLKGTTTVNAVNGVASFSGIWMELTGASFTLAANSSGLPAATSAAFAITAAPPASLAYVHPPANDTAGAHLAVTVRVRDRFGNTVPFATDSVWIHFSTNPTGTELFGDTAAVPVSGIATFPAVNVHVAFPGPYKIRAVSSGLDSAQSPGFIVTAASAVKNHFEGGGPVGGTVNTAITLIQVTARDTFDNINEAARNTTLSFGYIPYAPAHMTGTLTKAANTGFTNFYDIVVDRPATYPGVPFRIVASSAGLRNDTNDLYVGWTPFTLEIGRRHTCGGASFGNLTMLCWGANDTKQIGNVGVAAMDSAPAPVLPSFASYVFSAGDGHTCGLVGTAASCWGANASGQVGNGLTGSPVASPATVSGGHTWFRIAAGGSHSCGLRYSDSTAWCWGENSAGQLGDNNGPADANVPVAVNGGAKYFWIATGQEHTCALKKADSTAWCWGRGTEGQLGQGSAASSNLPLAVTGGYKFVMIAAGDEHTCAIRNTYTTTNVYCWGLNSSGQLGDGNAPTNSSSPVPLAKFLLVNAYVVANSFNPSRNMALGASHGCVLPIGSQRDVMCWGGNTDGQIGPDGGASSANPVITMSGVNLSQDFVAAGGNTTCSYSSGANIGYLSGLYCVGRNTEGQIGSGDHVGGTDPIRVIQ